MNRKQKRKIFVLLSLIILLGCAAGLILYALKQNINLFYTPTQLMQAHLQPKQTVRIGGYVKKHSVQYDSTGSHVTFWVTDRVHEMSVSYDGVLPNLFREGQTVVVTGQLAGQQLIATEVLAKHDEKYMPRPLAKVLSDAEVRSPS